MKKMIWIPLVCLASIGAGAFLLAGGKQPVEPEQQTLAADEQSLDATVPEIYVPAVGLKTEPIDTGSAPVEDEDPVLTPFLEDRDVEVSLTPAVEKPAAAVIDPDPDTHEQGDEPAPPEPPAASPAPAQQPAATAPPASNEPSMGDTNSSGQVWVDGFGWVTPGGGNQGGVSGSDGDINKQVGYM